MSMDNILSRPQTAVSRNSDDFFPKKEDSFKEHLLENAYNSLYHNKLYCCDWDMFWTNHPDSAKHALLRAISGGPVYISDRVGETDADVLKPLAYSDGELLMMERSALPTEDCVFSDPFVNGCLKLHNVAAYGDTLTGGGIAIFNLSENESSCSFSPSEVEGISVSDSYLVYDYYSKSVMFAGYNEKIECSLEKGGYAWYVILPLKDEFACLGLTEKYAGFTAVESVVCHKSIRTVILHESGTVAWVSEKATAKISVNGKDMTAFAIRNGKLTILPLSEKSGLTVAVIEFD